MSKSKSMTSVARNGRHEPYLQKCFNVVLGDGSTNFLQSEATATTKPYLALREMWCFTIKAAAAGFGIAVENCFLGERRFW
jgi:hypothetical protein